MKAEYTPEMAHAAAKRGSAWMDRHCPNWINEINISGLDLANSYTCILGQSAECLLPGGPKYQSYADVTVHFWPKSGNASATRLGFNVPASHRMYGGPVAYEMLTIAWLELIQARREAAA